MKPSLHFIKPAVALGLAVLSQALAAQGVQPRYAEPVQPRYAEPVRPRYAEPVQPRYAQPVQPRYAERVQQRHAEGISRRQAETLQRRPPAAAEPYPQGDTPGYANPQAAAAAAQARRNALCLGAAAMNGNVQCVPGY